MDVRSYVARFMVHKVGAFVVKGRVMCFTAHGFSTYDLDTQQVTNSWSYADVESAAPLDGSETDFAIATPRHRIKKTVYRCPYRMEVLVCLMRLRSQHQARTPNRALLPELRSEAFSCIKYHHRGLQSPCVVEIGPDGVNQRDDEGELLSHIPYTSLVSIDLVCDDHNAIVLNHSDSSSLFVVDKRQRTEMAQAIHRVMRAYHIEINEYRKKTMEAAIKVTTTSCDEPPEILWQYPVTPVSVTNKPLTPRVLAASDTYLAEYGDHGAVISSRPLARIFSLVVFRDLNEAFEIVYVDGIHRTFYSPHRERLLTELLASCHAIQNKQVDITIERVPDALRMVPCKTIQSEGAKLLGSGGGNGVGGEANKELHATDRELRIIQASLLQHLATHGSSKTVRSQRQLPQGLDEGFHTLALEFNANTPTVGVIAQPNKPFDKAIFYVAREIRDIVVRHGPRQPFLMTYLQTLYRLLHAPPAMKEFVGFVLERGSGYLGTITELLVGRDPVVLYWILMVLQRLLESKSHRIQVREVLLSNSTFLSTLLSLFDLDPKTQRYLLELSTMKLAQFVLLLVTTNPERQLELSKTLHEQLARRARMLHRILFGFPGLATVEACVGILGRMTSTPSSVHFQGDTTETSASAASSASALLAARAMEAPPLSMGFGEHLIFEPEQGRQHGSSTHVSRRALVARLGTVRSTRMVMSSRSSISNASDAGGIAVQNPEVLLRQYRLFLETSAGPKKQAMDLYKEPIYLRLRYRCRNVFLQELMSHLAGSFDDFKRVFAVECVQFSGFLGKTSGQREKSDLYLTPRALVAVRLVNRNTHEFEFRSIQRLCVPSEPRDTFCIIVKGKHLYIYSESRTQMLEKMRELAGVIGICLICEDTVQLPKPTAEVRRRSSSAPALDGWDPRSIVNVVKRSGRHGFFRFRKKQIGVMNGMLLEADLDKHSEKSYSLKELRRLVCVPSPHTDHHEVPIMIALDFADGNRIAYLSNNDASLLANLYDCCLYCQNAWVTLSPAFTRVNPRLTARSLVRRDDERAAVLNKAGMFVSMFRELSKDFEKLSVDGAAITSALFEKVLFGLENLNYNVEEDDFRSTADGKIALLSFRTMFQGLAAMLQYAQKPPMRRNEIAIVLEAFCRVNDGWYRLASDETPERISSFVKRLTMVIEAADQLTTLWAIRALHSLAVDSRRAPSHKQAEKATRALILGHEKLIGVLVGVLERDSQPVCALAALDLLYDVVVKGRASTDNNHFDVIIKRLSMNASRLQTMAAQTTVVGVAVFATGLLRATLDHTDVHAHQRMCDASLQSGRTLRSLFNAFFFPTEAGRLTFQYIAAMWIVHHKPSFELLQSLLPRGFLRMISTPVVKKSLLQLHESGQKRVNGKERTKMKKHRDEARGGGSEWFIRRMRQEIATHLPGSDCKAKVREDGARANYAGECHGDVALLAELLQQDFFLPDVIWNGRMREELKSALERTLSLIDGVSSGATKLQPSLCWNHWQFMVEYPSIADEIEIDHVFLRVLVARVRDGSLQLDEARKAVAAMANGGHHHGFTGEAQQILHSIGDIVVAPRTFYDAVYQRWLEMRLRGPSVGGSHAMECSQLRLSELCAQPAAEAGEELLMTTLVEMAKSFPSIRAMPSSRVNFLLELVSQSFEAREVGNLIQLLAHCSADSTTTRHLIKHLHLSTIVYLAVLSHRRPRGRPNGLATIGDCDEFPVIDCDFETSECASISSIPMTQFSGNSRLSLRWRCKRNGDKDEDADGPMSALDLHHYLKRSHPASLPLHQVTVCCCTIHDKHDSSEHEWRVLYQVPELRWMELVAEPLDAAAVGVRALTIVRNVVRNEPNGSIGTSSGYLVPLPTAKKLLSTKETLAHLVQLLLVDDTAVRTLTCEILRSLGPASGPKLFEFGLFFFVFATESGATDPASVVADVTLLQQFHRVQDCRETRAGQSFLLDMLPEPLIALLDSESAEFVADVFTGRTTDKRVLWTASMRQHLRLTVREHIEEFLEDLERDVAATYRYVSLPPIKYHELSRDVYCSGYFLSTIADGDNASLDAIEEPQILMGAIEEKWRVLRERHTSSHFHSVEEESATAFKTFGWQRDQLYTMTELRVRYRDLCKKGAAVATVRAAYESLSSLLERKQERANGRTSDDVIECILLSQLRLLEKFSFQFFSYESRALPLLLSSITSDTKFGDLCVQILHLLLSSAPLNILSLLELDSTWDRLLDMVDHYAMSTNYAAKSAAFSILEIIVSSEHGPRSLLRSGGCRTPTPAPSRLLSDVSDTTTTDDEGASLFAGGPTFYSQSQRMGTTQSRRLCKTLEQLLTSFEARQPWQIQKVLYGVVASLCANRHFQEQLVMSTKLFWRALYLLLSTAEDVAQGPASNASSDDGEIVALKERDVVEAGFHALRALSLGLDGQSRSQGLDALANLLPLEFLDCLDRPNGHDFWMILSTDIRAPTCIWNGTTRSELLQMIADHCNGQNHDDDDELLFLESATSYMYDCLKSEPLVGGIYLRILIARGESDQKEAITTDCLYPSTPHDFVQALFVFLNENRDPTVGIYADTLPALQCLNVLVDLPVFKEAIVDVLEQHADAEDSENESVSVATLGRYLLPFDRTDKGSMSISSRRSLSSYGFLTSTNGRHQAELDGLPPGMEAEFGNVDYLNRQEFALLILNKLCGLEFDLEKMFAPFCRYTWSLQVIADHLDYEQAFYALSCLAELCDTCLVVAEYVEMSGLWVEILGIAIQSRQHVLHEHFLRAEALREPAFEVLYALLTKDFAVRESMYSGLGRFLPYPIVYQIHLDPSLAGKFFDDNHEKSDLIWNSYWRTEVRRTLDEVICRNRIERSKAKRDSVILTDDDYVHMPENFIAGLYLDNFLARPDPEDLTNPAYNLELLFQEWKEKLHCLMGFDLENPPQFLKDLAAEVEQLTTAMTHILRAPLGIEESIEAFDMPGDVLKLVRHCNKLVVAGFPYRCTLRIARQLANFEGMQSQDFLELLFCRVTVDHPDIPVLVKLLRRVLEARAQASDQPFLLKDLAYFSSMVKYLETVVGEKKDTTDAKVLSNINRILRIIKTEQRNETKHRDGPMSQSFFQRMSAHWHNATLLGINSQATDPLTGGGRPSRLGEVDIDAMMISHQSMMSHASFDVDAEHGRDRPSLFGTFNVDEERERDVDQGAEVPPPAPRSKYLFDGETIHAMATPPRSFRFVNGVDASQEPSQPVARASLIRATYEPVDRQYHSTKAAQYDREDETIVDQSRRTSLSHLADDTNFETKESEPRASDVEPIAELMGRDDTRMIDASQTSGMLFSLSGMPSTRRNSLLDSWRGPSSNRPNSLLSSMTISRHGRRATAVFSRRKTHQSGRWFK